MQLSQTCNAFLRFGVIHSFFKQLMALPCKLAYLLVRIYQYCISPLYVPTCRFQPTCSEYTALALKTHGLVRGSLLVVWRLMRCHPFCKGGYDPVPQKTLISKEP